MNVYIICNSKTGFTRQYAQWIAEEVGGTVLPYKGHARTPIDLKDIVIFGTRLHAGRVEHLGKIKERFKNHRNLIVFATGGVPGHVTEAVEKVWAGNFTQAERSAIPHFYMQGGICYEKMGFVDRMVMKAAAKLMRKQKQKKKDMEELADSEDGFAERIQNSYDISSWEFITPLVEYVRTLST